MIEMREKSLVSPKGWLDVSVLVVYLLLVLVHLVQHHHFLWSFSLATLPVVCALLSSSSYVLLLTTESSQPLFSAVSVVS